MYMLKPICMDTIKRTNPLKSARKTFKFWFKFLLTTPHMDNTQFREEFIEALDAIKIKKKKGV